MTDDAFDPEIAELADRLDAVRPRSSRGLRQRVRSVLDAGLRRQALRRQSVWLVTAGALTLGVAAVLALNAPT